MNIQSPSELQKRLEQKYIERERDILLICLFAPLIAYFLVLWVIPLIYGLGMSFYRAPTAPTSTFVGLENYYYAISEVDIVGVLGNTFVFTFGSTILSVLIGLLFALLLNQAFFGSDFTRSLFILPYLLPTVIVVLFFTGLMNPNFGIISISLSKLGILEDPISLFGSIKYAMPAVISVAVWKYASFAFFIFLAQLQAIDKTLYERARVEGSSVWQQFKNITLPNLTNSIFLVFIIRAIYTFNMFDLIWIATKGGPINVTTTLPIKVYSLSYLSNRLGAGLALAGLMFLFVSLAAIVYFTVFDPMEGEI